MYSRWYILLNLICFCTLLNAASNFGLIKLHIRKFETCKGPKRTDCCVSSLHVDNATKIVQDFNVLENIHLTHGKIVGVQGGKEILKFPVRNPCNMMIVKLIFNQFLNITEGCTIMKGRYILTVDLEEMSRKFFNGQYFYGRLTIKSTYYGEKCNFFCTLLELDVDPKD